MLQVFTNSMIHQVRGFLSADKLCALISTLQENPSMIINTGSKQGITSPP
jgi:hypothetical protein